jgi:hypothetical protein
MCDTSEKIIKEIAILAQERDCYKEMFNMQVKLVGDLEVKRFRLQKMIEEIQEKVKNLEKAQSSRRYSNVPEMIVDTLGKEDSIRILISMFVQEVERRAEEKMLKTGKLEGAHYAAMKQIADEWAKNPSPKPNPSPDNNTNI